MDPSSHIIFQSSGRASLAKVARDLVNASTFPSGGSHSGQKVVRQPSSQLRLDPLEFV